VLTPEELAERDALRAEFAPPVGRNVSAPGGLSPEEIAERDALRAEFAPPPVDMSPREATGKPQPVSMMDVAGNALSGAGYAIGDIPAGLEQLASRYLPVSDSYKRGADARVDEYEAEKRAALEKPGGTAGYVGGQIGTAFIPGTGAAKVLSTAGKGAKVAAAARPVAAGTALTAVKPYDTEEERLTQSGISAGLGAAAPAVVAGLKGVTGAVRGAVAPSASKVAGEGGKRGELLGSAAALGVKPTPGQGGGGLPGFLESQMAKLPGSRKTAQAASQESQESYHRALGKQIGLDDTPILTQDIIEGARSRLSETYDEIVPQANVVKGTAGARKMFRSAFGLAEPFSDVIGSTVKKSAMKELERLKNGVYAGLESGGISGEELKVLNTRVRQLGEDPKLHNAVKDRLSKFREQLNETVASSLDDVDPELAGRLRLTDKQWANASILSEVGSTPEGFVEGPKLYRAIVRKYKNPSKAGDFGKLGEIGETFYKKPPDSGSADRMLSNAILTGGVGAAAYGVLDPSSLAALYAVPKAVSSAYYRTPGYLKSLGAAGAVGSAGVRAGASGAGREPSYGTLQELYADEER